MFDRDRRSDIRPMGDPIDAGPTWIGPRLAHYPAPDQREGVFQEKKTNLASGGCGTHCVI